MGTRKDKTMQVSCYISQEMAKDFKVACIRRELKQADALEEAIKEWLQKE